MWSPKRSQTRLFDDSVSNYLQKSLRAVVEEGTGKAAQLTECMVSGKTGTTSGNRDSWFAGSCGKVTAVVWVGKDNNSPVKNGGGGRLAAPLWRAALSPQPGSLQPEKKSEN